VIRGGFDQSGAVSGKKKKKNRIGPIADRPSAGVGVKKKKNMESVTIIPNSKNRKFSFLKLYFTPFSLHRQGF